MNYNLLVKPDNLSVKMFLEINIVPKFDYISSKGYSLYIRQVFVKVWVSLSGTNQVFQYDELWYIWCHVQMHLWY